MNSSNNKTRDNLAGARSPMRQLSALKDLANLRDDSASFEWFARRWPDLAYILDHDDPGDNFQGHSYGERHARMPANLPKRFVMMWQEREALREIWRGSSEKLTDVFWPHLEIMACPDPEGLWPPQLRVDWQRSQFVYVPRSEFERAVYELFRHSSQAKV